MSTSQELRQALRARGITNGRKLAEYMGSKDSGPEPVIYFMVENDTQDVRAELHYVLDGKPSTAVFEPDDDFEGISQLRRNCLNQAKQEAQEKLSIFEWSRSPFSNCWLPSDVISKVHEQFEDVES